MEADPAEVIAAALQNPPEWPARARDPGPAARPVLNGPEMLWQYHTQFATPGAPALARHLAAGIVEALTAAGWMIVPSGDTVPTAAQVRRWLLTHGWMPDGNGGTAGTVWTSPSRGVGVGVPYGDDDPELIKGAISRVARHLGQADDRITREMLDCDDAG